MAAASEKNAVHVSTPAQGNRGGGGGDEGGGDGGGGDGGGRGGGGDGEQRHSASASITVVVLHFSASVKAAPLMSKSSCQKHGRTCPPLGKVDSDMDL